MVKGQGIGPAGRQAGTVAVSASQLRLCETSRQGVGGCEWWWACCCPAVQGRAGSGLTWTARCSASSPRCPAIPRTHTVPAGRQHRQRHNCAQQQAQHLQPSGHKQPLFQKQHTAARSSAAGQLNAPPLPPPVIFAPKRAGGSPRATAASCSSCTRSTSKSVPPAADFSRARHTACCQRECSLDDGGEKGSIGKPARAQRPGWQ